MLNFCEKRLRWRWGAKRAQHCIFCDFASKPENESKSTGLSSNSSFFGPSVVVFKEFPNFSTHGSKYLVLAFPSLSVKQSNGFGRSASKCGGK